MTSFNREMDLLTLNGILKERSLILGLLTSKGSEIKVTKVKAILRKILADLILIGAPIAHKKCVEYMIAYKTKKRKELFKRLVLRECIIFETEELDFPVEE